MPFGSRYFCRSLRKHCLEFSAKAKQDNYTLEYYYSFRTSYFGGKNLQTLIFGKMMSKKLTRILASDTTSMISSALISPTATVTVRFYVLFLGSTADLQTKNGMLCQKR